MSDLVKMHNTSQFNWYTCWASLGANSMPDKLIKEGLKQPDWIKISFKKNSKDSNSKEIIGHVAPNQARFGTEYFLAYTLPNFNSKILTQLLDAQKDDGPLLFSLMNQCFQRCRPDQVDQHHCAAMAKRIRLYEGKLWQVYLGIPWGHCQVPEYRQPADLLAPYFQEAHSLSI